MRGGTRTGSVRGIDRQVAVLWDEGWLQGALWQCLIPEVADPALSL